MPNPAIRVWLCSMNVLVWFKRDLRVADHPALTFAAGLGRVVALYILEPDYWRQPDTSGRQWEFTEDSLAGLRAELAALGVTLALRQGEAVEVLERFCRRHAITRMASHEETGNLWTYARDRKVAAWARAGGVEWTELPQSGVLRGRPSAEVLMASPALPVPPLQGVEGVEPGPIPAARTLRLAEDPCPHRQRGGRAEGLALLDSFLSVRGEGYRTALSPLDERASSRLSPHLALGTLSLREVVEATAARQAERMPGWGGALARFQARLADRDLGLQRLEDRPDLERRGLSPLAEGLRARETDAARLQAWATGQTGLPFVDACMRYLAATGWLNARLRAMAMTVATCHLGLDWRVAGQVLARRVTDYEPALHWPQVQMLAGVAGSPPRPGNPVRQGQQIDPTGAFTRRWLPELAAVPDVFLQEPWKWPGFSRLAGRRYPEAVVDPARAAKAMREMQRLRAGVPGKPRHAMRVGRASGQLSLDL